MVSPMVAQKVVKWADSKVAYLAGKSAGARAEQSVYSLVDEMAEKRDVLMADLMV
jgi:predicted DNA-binding ribbon-helix-helix protein